MGHQKEKKHIARCASSLFCRFLHGIGTAFATYRKCSGSHTPPEDRGARTPGAGCGYIRQRRNSRNTKTFEAPRMRCFFHSLVTHPLISRPKRAALWIRVRIRRQSRLGARSQAAGRANIRHRRNSHKRADLYQDKHTPRCQSYYSVISISISCSVSCMRISITKTAFKECSSVLKFS